MVIGRQILSYWVSVPFQNQTAKLPGWVSLVEMASFFEKIGRIFQAQTAPPSCAKPLTWQTNGLGALSQGFERLFHDLRLSSHVWDCLFDIKTVSPWFLVFVTHFLLEARKCKAAFLPWQNGKDLRNRERDSLKCKISLKFSASDSQPPNVQAPSNNFSAINSGSCNHPKISHFILSIAGTGTGTCFGHVQFSGMSKAAKRTWRSSFHDVQIIWPNYNISPTYVSLKGSSLP